MVFCWVELFAERCQATLVESVGGAVGATDRFANPLERHLAPQVHHDDLASRGIEPPHRRGHFRRVE